ncbi:MAG: hypothetical protein WAL63_02360 [Solirubrobacteraceae bacterium]
MSARHVLGVLEDDECRLWATFDRAVGLAASERARLTLAKTTNPGRLLRWFAPSALHSMCVSAEELDFCRIAGHTLARAAEFVPGSIPVTTVLLGDDTTSSLATLIRGGTFDAFVATDAVLTRKLRADLRRLGVRTVVVPRRPRAAESPSADTTDRTPSASRS